MEFQLDEFQVQFALAAEFSRLGRRYQSHVHIRPPRRHHFVANHKRRVERSMEYFAGLIHRRIDPVNHANCDSRARVDPHWPWLRRRGRWRRSWRWRRSRGRLGGRRRWLFLLRRLLRCLSRWIRSWRNFLGHFFRRRPRMMFLVTRLSCLATLLLLGFLSGLRFRRRRSWSRLGGLRLLHRDLIVHGHYAWSLCRNLVGIQVGGAARNSSRQRNLALARRHLQIRVLELRVGKHLRLNTRYQRGVIHLLRAPNREPHNQRHYREYWSPAHFTLLS